MMTGTTSGWAQTNNLSNNKNYSNLTFWYNSPSKVTGLEYNHVAVAAWSVQNGVSGSVESTINAGEVQEFSYVASIASNKLIQDKSKLHVVALLIDKTTGIIVNAVQTTIKDKGTGIETVESRPMTQAAGIYTLGGKVVSTPQKGVNIVRMADGSARKMVVR